MAQPHDQVPRLEQSERDPPLIYYEIELNLSYSSIYLSVSTGLSLQSVCAEAS